MYKVVITLDKCAILLFYLRIFPQQNFRRLCHAGLAFIASSGIAYLGGTIFQCTPIAYFWDHTIHGGRCILNAPFWISYSTLNIATDLYILILPMPLLYKLTLTPKDKWGVIACFALGGLFVLLLLFANMNADQNSVCFATIIRMTTLAGSAKGTDFTCESQNLII